MFTCFADTGNEFAFDILDKASQKKIYVSQITLFKSVLETLF
jgi:hypothetical protein